MKRASAESGSPGTGLATRHAEHTGPDAPQATETFFDLHHEKIYGLAMSILMNKRDAEEATQDVFLAVVRMADRFREDSENPSWIDRICVNTCLKRLRKRRRTGTVPIEEFLPVFSKEGAHAMPVEDWSREVEGRVPEKELGQVMRGFTEELPEKYRLVFALCDVQEFSCEETSQILNLTIAEVKSHLHRARLYQRERLGRYFRDGRVV